MYIQNKTVRGSLIASLLKAYIATLTENPNAPVSIKVYNFYLALGSTSRKSFDYVSVNLDGIALQIIQKREYALIKKHNLLTMIKT